MTTEIKTLQDRAVRLVVALLALADFGDETPHFDCVSAFVKPNLRVGVRFRLGCDQTCTVAWIDESGEIEVDSSSTRPDGPWWTTDRVCSKAAAIYEMALNAATRP